MAAAVRQRAVPHVLEDILSFAHGLAMSERIVQPEDAGTLVAELSGLEGVLVLGVLRGRDHITFQQLETFRLAPGDAVVFLEDETSEAPLSPRR